VPLHRYVLLHTPHRLSLSCLQMSKDFSISLISHMIFTQYTHHTWPVSIDSWEECGRARCQSKALRGPQTRRLSSWRIFVIEACPDQAEISLGGALATLKDPTGEALNAERCSAGGHAIPSTIVHCGQLDVQAVARGVRGAMTAPLYAWRAASTARNREQCRSRRVRRLFHRRGAGLEPCIGLHVRYFRRRALVVCMCR
jgi:hypothetical protein